MPNYINSTAAASATVGADLWSSEVWARQPQDRTLHGVACRGSAAAGDTEVEVFIDEVRVGNFFNNTTGFPDMDDVFPLAGLYIPGGAQLRCIVRDAAATNPINTLVVVEDA